MMSRLLLPRWAIEGSRKIVTQVVVSFCATACVAVLTQSFFKEPASPALQKADVQLNDLAAENLLKTGFQAGARAKGFYPSEFEVLAPPSMTASLPATPSIVFVREIEPAPVVKPVRRAAVAAACSIDCPNAAATMLPPARPAEDRAAAEVPEQSAEVRKPEDRRIFGMRVPEFVPSGETIVKSGAMAVNSLVSLGTTAIDLTTGAIR